MRRATHDLVVAGIFFCEGLPVRWPVEGDGAVRRLGVEGKHHQWRELGEGQRGTPELVEYAR